MSVSDRIEKKVLLSAPRERVWRALSVASEFGAWFGMEIEGQIAPGVTLRARIVPTKVDPEIAAQQKAYENMPFDLFFERVEPPRVMSFRWHPYPEEEAGDISSAPTTLVTFELEDAEGGTLLTVSESGFDRIPIERRAKAFAANEGGWEIQTRLIAKYLAHAGE